MKYQEKQNFNKFKQLDYNETQVSALKANHVLQNIMNEQISPIKQNKFGDSIITNIFQNNYRLKNQFSYPISLNPKCQNQSISNKIQQVTNRTDNQNKWRDKYQQLYKNYQIITKKCQARTKQMFKMEQKINSQSNLIRQLQQQNVQLTNKLNGILIKAQKNQRWSNNNSQNYGQDFYNGGQVNRFYVQELQRSIDNLQKQNRRLSDIVMRKVKHSLDF